MRAMRAQLFVAVFSALLVKGPAYGQSKWSSLKPIPQGEEEVYGTAAGGKLYVLGGLGVFPGWEPKRMLWSFDPATSEWTRLQNLPEGIHHRGFAAVGGKLYSVGGFTIARPPTGLPAWVPSKSVWIYDIGSASWSKGPDLPTARGALTATADGTTAAQAAGAGATAIVAGSAIFGTKDYAAAISAIRASAAAAVRS